MKTFLCACSSHILTVEHDKDNDLVDIAIFTCGLADTWRNRIKWAWYAITGNLNTDNIVLSKEQVANLVDELVKIQND